MGYYTSFTLTLLKPTGEEYDSTEPFLRFFSEAQEYESIDAKNRFKFADSYYERVRASHERVAKVPTVTMQNLQYEDSHKWYDHEEEMKVLSALFPEFIFQLEGVGEGTGDLWRKWFYRGQMQGGKAELVYPKLDLKAFTADGS